MRRNASRRNTRRITRARRRQQEQQAEDVGDEAGGQQQRAAEDHEHAVGHLARGRPAALQRLVEAPPRRAALRAHQQRAEDRVGDEERDRPPHPDRLADLDDHRQLGDRDDDEEREEQEGIARQATRNRSGGTDHGAEYDRRHGRAAPGDLGQCARTGGDHAAVRGIGGRARRVRVRCSRPALGARELHRRRRARRVPVDRRAADARGSAALDREHQPRGRVPRPPALPPRAVRPAWGPLAVRGARPGGARRAARRGRAAGGRRPARAGGVHRAALAGDGSSRRPAGGGGATARARAPERRGRTGGLCCVATASAASSRPSRSC